MAKKKGTLMEISPREKIITEINQLCTVIGDKYFLIRQTENEIKSHYTQIDNLRVALADIGKENGKPEVVK